MTRLIELLRWINDGVAVGAGVALLACVALTLIEIVARRFGAPFGGIDEISGYVMAVTTSWGVSYALTCQAHVRIDLLRVRCAPASRALFDALAILCLAATALVVAYRAWPVLEKTLSTGARANTPLETPLWIPQALWWAGWVWFALSAVVIALAVLAHLAKRRYDEVDEIAGVRSET